MTHPLDTIRIRMQTARLTRPLVTLHCVPGVGGVLPRQGCSLAASCAARAVEAPVAAIDTCGLFRGALIPMLSQGARTLVIFFGYDVAMRRLRSTGGAPPRLVDHAMAGAAGGILASPLTNAVDLVKCRIQTAANDGFGNRGQRGAGAALEWHVCRTVWRKEGLRGFTCGHPLTALRDALFRGVYFPTIDAVSRRGASSSRISRGDRAVRGLVAGGAAGVASWLLVYPLDVLKTHWQTGNRFGALTPLSLLQRGLAAQGLPWLFRGFGPTLLRAFAMNGVVISVYETLR